MTSRLNWNKADRRCRKMHKGAHLLVIDDAREQVAVMALLRMIRGDAGELLLLLLLLLL